MDVGKAIDDVLAKRDQSWETFARAANRHGYRTGFVAGVFAGALVVAITLVVLAFVLRGHMA